MEEKKKNNKTYLLISLGVLGAIVLTLGVTYAYWRLTKEQTNENVVTTACLDVDIESQQDDIYLPKAYPISDTDAENLVPFKFTIHNNCEDIARYQINLESMSKKDGEDILEAQRLNPKYLKYKINEVGKNGKIGLLTGEKNNDTTKVATTITDAYDAHILTTGYLKAGASKSFEFRIWMDGEITAEEVESMNKTLVSKISVTSTYATEVPLTLEETILGLDTQEENSGATGLYEVDHTGANIEFTTETEKVQNLQKKEYRYAGKDPNNYVDVGETEPKDIYEIQVCYESDCYWGSGMGIQTFATEEECEIMLQQLSTQEGPFYGATCKQKTKAGDKIYWRVIGLVNTPEGQRVKIIRDSSIGRYSWDSSAENVNNGSGVNEWSQSDLMKLLNPTFDEEDVNNSLYWNGTNGDCYVDSNEQTETCDFTYNGMPEELKKMVEEVTWNTGSIITYGEEEKLTPIKMYEYERSKNNGKQLCEITCDEEERTVSWRGKVGLMYASDYGYATSGGSEDSRSQCLNEDLYYWNFDEPDHPDCYGNNWLFPPFVVWSITPASSQFGSDLVLIVGYNAENIEEASQNFLVNPSIYLQSDVIVVGGNGSKENPWILSVD